MQRPLADKVCKGKQMLINIEAISNKSGSSKSNRTLSAFSIETYSDIFALAAILANTVF